MPKPLVAVVKIGRRGEIVLPKRMRNSLDLQEGDELVASVEERRLVLERRARHFGAYLDVLSGGVGGGTPDDE